MFRFAILTLISVIHAAHIQDVLTGMGVKRTLEAPQRIIKKLRTNDQPQLLIVDNEVVVDDNGGDEWDNDGGDEYDYHDDYDDHYLAECCMDDDYTTAGSIAACDWDNAAVFCDAINRGEECTAQDIAASFEAQCGVPLPDDIFEDEYHPRSHMCGDATCYELFLADTNEPVPAYCDQCSAGTHNDECILGFVPHDFTCLFDSGSCSVMVDMFNEEESMDFDEGLSQFLNNLCGTNCAGDLEALSVNYAENCDDIDVILDNFPPSIRDYIPDIEDDVDPSAVADMVREMFDLACSEHQGEYCIEQLAGVVSTVEDAPDVPTGVRNWLEDVCVPGGCLEQMSDSFDNMAGYALAFGNLDVDLNFHMYDGVICVKTEANEFCAVEIVQFIFDQIEEGEEDEEDFEVEDLPALIDELLGKLCSSCFEGYMKAFRGILETALDGIDLDRDVALHADLICARTSDDAETDRDFCATATFEYMLDEDHIDELDHCVDDDDESLIEDCNDDAFCKTAIQEMQVFVGKNCVEWSGSHVKESLDMFHDIMVEMTNIFWDEWPNVEEEEAFEMAEEIIDDVSEWSDMVMRSAEMIVNCPTRWVTTGGDDSAAVTVHVGTFVTILSLLVAVVLLK